MNKALIFIYVFLAYVAASLAVILHLAIKPEPVKCFHDPTEYQLVIEDDYIIISYYGRKVTQLPLDSTCNLGDILIKDNE